MNVDVKQIRNNSRALIQQSRGLVKKSRNAIEQARKLSNFSREMRQELQPRTVPKRPRT